MSKKAWLFGSLLFDFSDLQGQSVVQKTKSSKPGLPSSKENSSPLKKTGSGLSGSLGGSHHERKHSTGSNISGGGERVSDNSRTRSSSPRVDESSSLKKPSQVRACRSSFSFIVFTCREAARSCRTVGRKKKKNRDLWVLRLWNLCF